MHPSAQTAPQGRALTAPAKDLTDGRRAAAHLDLLTPPGAKDGPAGLRREHLMPSTVVGKEQMPFTHRLQ